MPGIEENRWGSGKGEHLALLFRDRFQSGRRVFFDERFGLPIRPVAHVDVVAKGMETAGPIPVEASDPTRLAVIEQDLEALGPQPRTAHHYAGRPVGPRLDE